MTWPPRPAACGRNLPRARMRPSLPGRPPVRYPTPLRRRMPARPCSATRKPRRPWSSCVPTSAVPAGANPGKTCGAISCRSTRAVPAPRSVRRPCSVPVSVPARWPTAPTLPPTTARPVPCCCGCRKSSPAAPWLTMPCCWRRRSVPGSSRIAPGPCACWPVWKRNIPVATCAPRPWPCAASWPPTPLRASCRRMPPTAGARPSRPATWWPDSRAFPCGACSSMPGTAAVIRAPSTTMWSSATSPWTSPCVWAACWRTTVWRSSTAVARTWP